MAHTISRIFLTGASGFLGGYVLNALADHDLLGTVHSQPVAKAPKPLLGLDLTDADKTRALLDEFNPDCIIHTAAISNLDACEKEPERARAVNVKSTEVLAEWAGTHTARLIFLSSEMVFDGRKTKYTEDTPPLPMSVYGQTKVEAETHVLQLDRGVVLRSALQFGVPLFGGTSFLMWMLERLENNQSAPLFIDQYRSPIWARNLVDLIIELIDHDFSGILNAGGANRIDRFSFGLQVCDTGGFDAGRLEPTSMFDNPHVAPRPQDVSLDISKTQALLTTPILTTNEALQRIFKS